MIFTESSFVFIWNYYDRLVDKFHISSRFANFAYESLLNFGHKLLTVGPDHMHDRFKELLLVRSVIKSVKLTAQGQILHELEKVSDQVLRVAVLPPHDLARL